MEYFPAPLEKLVEQFARLPGIGGKSAQRLAFYVLGLPEAEAREFADAILDAKKSVTCCPVCQNFTAGGLCPICASPKRDGSVICVVADPRDVAAIERAREYNGRYHVLHGVISPMNHVGPDDLHVKELVGRVEERSPQTVAEYRTKLEARMTEVLSNTQLDPARILTEAAIFADKVAVDEETVRLRSHIEQLREMLDKGGAIGRKLDFLIQEFNREANTIGSKAQDAEMARIVVELKCEIEKVREQIQNIE